LLQIISRYGQDEAAAYANHLQDYAERMVRALLKQLPDGTYAAEDFLDDDGIGSSPVRIRAALTIRRGTLEVDFGGTDAQVGGSLNAVLAITVSAVYYVVRALVREPIPASSGVLRPIRIIAPEGSVVNARYPAAVAAGNVETSQRIVDVLLRALGKAAPGRIPAASSGTMNNVTLGGRNPADNSMFSYYETIAGGMGASEELDGDNGVHTHMTNSLNTPIEALEYAFPFRVRRYSLRRHSGGSGARSGGDGIVRELELLADADVTILSDRRRFGPWGLAGGLPGRVGKTILATGRRRRSLPSKVRFQVRSGQRIIIETPGGGGWGKCRGR
jgi:N-methylhydantoinase B